VFILENGAVENKYNTVLYKIPHDVVHEIYDIYDAMPVVFIWKIITQKDIYW
jgi:hypothetical protein